MNNITLDILGTVGVVLCLIATFIAAWVLRGIEERKRNHLTLDDTLRKLEEQHDLYKAAGRNREAAVTRHLIQDLTEYHGR